MAETVWRKQVFIMATGIKLIKVIALANLGNKNDNDSKKAEKMIVQANLMEEKNSLYFVNIE